MTACRQPQRRAFTLIELLVVVAIIALLISILLPSLARAREQTKSLKCLANLKSMGQGAITFAAGEKDSLPGPLHPAVYRDMSTGVLQQRNPTWTIDTITYYQQRQLTYQLKRVLNDSSDTKNTVSDQIATCPISAVVNTTTKPPNDSSPTDYAINNYGGSNPEQSGTAVGNPRTTEPNCYFGFSAAPGSTNPPSTDPRRMSQIKKSSEEWMVADAWYRPASANTAFPELQQEGPFQSDWTGLALPPFAPHFAGRSYGWSSTGARNADSTTVRDSRKDGRTNTVFFDGHAASEKSRTLMAGPTFVVMYGFRGTVSRWPPRNSGGVVQDKFYWSD